LIGVASMRISTSFSPGGRHRLLFELEAEFAPGC
jgi:hypothetical protein